MGIFKRFFSKPAQADLSTITANFHFPDFFQSVKPTGQLTFPRKGNGERCKATKRGAIHWVGKPGTGGAARALRRASA